MTFEPYKDDERVLCIGDLTIENGTQEIGIYGDLRLSYSQDSRAQATALLEFATRLVKALEEAR